MSAFKGTPGPWYFVPAGGHLEFGDDGADMGRFVGASGEIICDFGDCTQYYPSQGTPPSEANARLIAAAPELLGALIGLLPQTFTGNPSRKQEVEHWEREKNLGNGHAEAVLAAYAAIAKATGEQP